MTTPHGRTQALLCALFLLACVIVARPVAEIGINDDWSYIRTTQLFAESGRFFFNGWAAPVFGWLAWWGAVPIKVLGFSFTAVRLSMVPIALATTYLLHRLLERVGIHRDLASIGTLTVMVSPLALPLCCTFHTDIPALLGSVACLYGCVRAMQEPADARACFWLVTGSLAGDLGGMTRQTAWIASLFLVPAAGWLMRKRPNMLALSAGLVATTLVTIMGCMHWLYAHPHTVHESLTRGAISTDLLRHFVEQVIGIALAAPLYLLPVCVLIAAAFPVRDRRAKAVFLAISATLTLALLYKAHRHEVQRWLEPTSGTVITPYGALTTPLLGGTPMQLSVPLRIVLTVLSLGAGCAVVGALSRVRRRVEGPAGHLPLSELAVLLFPFAAVSCLALIPRAFLWFIQDRYMLPLFAIGVIVLLRVYQESFPRRLGSLGLLTAVAMAAFGTALLHDLFAMQRAKVQAVNEVAKAGVPLVNISGGFERDAWTQLEMTGYVTDYRMEDRKPGDLPAREMVPHLKCQTFSITLLPSLDPRYYLAYDPDVCGGGDAFAPVSFPLWLSPTRTIHILRAGEPSPGYRFPFAKQTDY